jgi:hypothetical protein
VVVGTHLTGFVERHRPPQPQDLDGEAIRVAPVGRGLAAVEAGQLWPVVSGATSLASP